MIRRMFRIGLLLGLLGGIAFALAKLLGGEDRERLGDLPSSPSPSPEPWPRLEADPTAAAPPIGRAIPDPVAPTKLWVEPADGACPTSHPVKAKLTSKIFHLPGMLNYERTRPDRCYADAAGAEADGLRPAKR